MAAAEEAAKNVSVTSKVGETTPADQGAGGDTSKMASAKGTNPSRDAEEGKSSLKQVGNSSSRSKRSDKSERLSLKAEIEKYDSKYYLLSLKGAPCCAAIIVIAVGLMTVVMLLIQVCVWSKGNPSALFYRQGNKSKKTK